MKQLKRTPIKNIEKSKTNFIVHLIIATMILVNFIIVLIFFNERSKYKIYNSAKEMYNSGDYYNAILTWEKAKDYNDSKNKMDDAGCKLVEQLASAITESNFADYTDKIRMAKKYAGLYSNEDPDKLLKFYNSILELDELDNGELHDITAICDYIDESPKIIFPGKIEQNSVLQLAKSLDGTWEMVPKNEYSSQDMFVINNTHVELKRLPEDSPLNVNYHIFYQHNALFIDYPGNSETEDHHYYNEIVDYTGEGDDSFVRYTYYVDDDKNLHDMSDIYNRVE